MCPPGWTTSFSKKSIYDNDGEKFLRTKHLAKYIKGADDLYKALCHLRSLDARCALLERVATLPSPLFPRKSNDLMMNLNKSLLSLLVESLALTDIGIAKNYVELICRQIDLKFLYLNADITTLKQLLTGHFADTFAANLKKDELEITFLIRYLTDSTEEVLKPSFMDKTCVLNRLLMVKLSDGSVVASEHSELFIALLSSSEGRMFFYHNKAKLQQHLSAEQMGYVNAEGESALLYLMSSPWMYKCFHDDNLFSSLTNDAVYCVAQSGFYHGDSMASRLVSMTKELSLSLAFIHDAKILSLLKPVELKLLFNTTDNYLLLVKNLSDAMKNLTAFKSIEKSLFETQNMHIFGEPLVQEAIAKLYLQMESSDVVILKADREHLMQYMGEVALNYRDAHNKTPVNYLMKYDEGVKRFTKDPHFTQLVSEASILWLDTEDQATFSKLLAHSQEESSVVTKRSFNI